MKTNIGVFLGGRSVEHEISVLSALQAIHGIDRERFDVTPVFISKEGLMYTGEALLETDNYKDIETLKKQCLEVIPSPGQGSLLLRRNPPSRLRENVIARIDVALPVTHGTFGEDGCLQGLLEFFNVPYAGCDVIASAIGMDKIRFKQIIGQQGLPLLPYVWVRSADWFADPGPFLAEVRARIGYPAIVKPANLGSSIGVTVVNDESQLDDALQLAGSFSDRIIVEKLVANLLEINCSVLGDADEARASVCEEPLRSSDFLSFADKYQSKSGGGKGMQAALRRIPADIGEDLARAIRDLALGTFHGIGASGVARVDFLVDRDSGKVYVNEINTIPGSLSFYLWEPEGLDFPRLIARLVELALKRARERAKLVFSNPTNILALTGKGGSKG